MRFFPSCFLIPSPVRQHPNTPRWGGFPGQGWFLVFPTAAVTWAGTTLMPRDMQPVPSLWAIKADPSPLVQPALSSALRSKIVAQSLALRRGNYWDSSSGEVCEGRGEIRGRKLSPILLNISTSQNFPCFVLSTVSPQTLVLYLSISLHTNISWLQAKNELNVTIYCLRAPLPLPEAEREIHL